MLFFTLYCVVYTLLLSYRLFFNILVQHFALCCKRDVYSVQVKKPISPLHRPWGYISNWTRAIRDRLANPPPRLVQHPSSASSVCARCIKWRKVQTGCAGANWTALVTLHTKQEWYSAKWRFTQSTGGCDNPRREANATASYKYVEYTGATQAV